MNIYFNSKSLTISECSASPQALKTLKELYRGYFFKPEGSSTASFKNIKLLELSRLLNDFFQDLGPQEMEFKRIDKVLERLTQLLSLENFEVLNGIKEASERLKIAELYREIEQRGRKSSSLFAQLTPLFEALIACLESLITIFGLGDFFKASENEIQAEMKSGRIMTLVTFFGMVSTAALSFFGAEVGGTIVGAFFLGTCFLSLIWPFIKPSPMRLPANAENWTREIQKTGCAAKGRKSSLDEIARILRSGKQHPILVGPSRVGKSLTAKSFVEAIERGDYPELSGKKVFRINTADILEQRDFFSGGGNPILNKISQAMGPHRKNIVLVFDEIHMACKDPVMADKLKPFLDSGGEFPHVIGITTGEEYDRYVASNAAFSNRFEKVEISNMTKNETLKVLSETLVAHPSRPLIESEVIEYIYAKSTEHREDPQPMTALKLLGRCIDRTGKSQRSDEDRRIEEVSSEILSLQARAVAERHQSEEVTKHLVGLSKELEELKHQVSSKSVELEKLFQMKKLWNDLVEGSYLTALRIDTACQNFLGSRNEGYLKKALIMDMSSRVLEVCIGKRADELGVKLKIDKALVDEEVVLAASFAKSEPLPMDP